MAEGSKRERVRASVLDLIEGLSSGDALPSERELAAELGVARMTLRRVLDQLEEEGRVARRHGKGSFVGDGKLAHPNAMSSFSEDTSRRGLWPGSRVVEFETVPAGARIGRRLWVSPSDPVVRATRLRLADGEPMAIERLHVPAGLVPGLAREDFEAQSFYALLRERYGIRVQHGLRTAEPTVTNEGESALLGVPLHSPAFLFERVTRDADHRVVEFVASVYRGDRYRIVSRLHPDDAAAGEGEIGHPAVEETTRELLDGGPERLGEPTG
ncbi:GntR family transcriptional regulator [Egibacter rhizosphaerae]|uniref:GntR family transcriptional regulator n=1 Tax=Egibacter rhizosphaerae TaxID=1670831 RepID=A0A411YL87_9ACTN|nr:GntR family transcriptional regulator [Egibacter rhizosphaerae]QBI21979.1 GntR family transcriptional regulator [Egibacter rhizosphaerae]